jgi:hypothetical protein
MSRFLVIDADGETIVAVLSMPQSDALVNVGAGQTLVAVAPAADTGAVIDNGSIKYSAADGLVLIADETPASSFSSYDLTEL